MWQLMANSCCHITQQSMVKSENMTHCYINLYNTILHSQQHVHLQSWTSISDLTSHLLSACKQQSQHFRKTWHTWKAEHNTRWTWSPSCPTQSSPVGNVIKLKSVSHDSGDKWQMFSSLCTLVWSVAVHSMKTFLVFREIFERSPETNGTSFYWKHFKKRYYFPILIFSNYRPWAFMN